MIPSHWHGLKYLNIGSMCIKNISKLPLTILFSLKAFILAHTQNLWSFVNNYYLGNNVS